MSVSAFARKSIGNETATLNGIRQSLWWLGYQQFKPVLVQVNASLRFFFFLFIYFFFKL